MKNFISGLLLGLWVCVLAIFGTYRFVMESMKTARWRSDYAARKRYWDRQ